MFGPRRALSTCEAAVNACAGADMVMEKLAARWHGGRYGNSATCEVSNTPDQHIDEDTAH